MKLLVCISKAPDTTSKIAFTDGNTKFDENGVQYIVNPYDEWYALVRALELVEANGGSVTTITVGGAGDEPTIRKALAIGANEAIRINATPTDGFFVAKQLAEIVKNGQYDLVICGKESLDYNGGMVPGMLAGLLGYNFVNSCIDLKVEGSAAKAIREMDGGKETIFASLPLVIGGQKGLVEEKDLRIPNMRGIMTARTKTLTVLEPVTSATNTKAIKFEKPAPKSAVKLVSADNLDELVSLLHNEAKVI